MRYVVRSMSTTDEVIKCNDLEALKCYDLEALFALNRLICAKINQVQHLTALTFTVGQRVQFVSSKKKFAGRPVTGRITKINHKTIDLLADSGTTTWRVTPNILKAI